MRGLKARNFVIVGILVFMSGWNFVLSWVEHEKKFYNLVAWSWGYKLHAFCIIFHAFVAVCWLFQNNFFKKIFQEHYQI